MEQRSPIRSKPRRKGHAHLRMTPRSHDNQQNADWTHPVDLIEPEPENPQDLVAEAVGKLLEQVMNRNHPPKELTAESIAQHLQCSFRNFIAMVYILRPELLPGDLPQWRLAEALGCTKAGFSRLCIIWSERLGSKRSGSMKSKAAREKYAMTNRRGQRGQSHTNPAGIGQHTDQDGKVRTARIISEAIAAFHAGRPWHQIHKRELRLAGYIGDGDQLTEAGRERMAPNVGDSYERQPTAGCSP